MATLLIVDDDPDIVEAATLLLQQKGHEVSAAASREEGMQAISNRQPDLLLLDVMMQQPDDGIAMAQELRRNGFDKPIIMLTSIAKVTGMEYGRDDSVVPVDAFLEKPVEAQELLEQVDALLAQ